MSTARVASPAVTTCLFAVEDSAQEVPRQKLPGICAEFTLAGDACQIVCVDDVVPRHVCERKQSRPRLVYLDGEIAHFTLNGRLYALVLAEATPPVVQPADSKSITQLLTNRELQIVQLICTGCLTKQVADRLRISEFTVRSYLKTIYCKLGVRSRGAMVFRYAQAFARVNRDERTKGP